MCYSDDEIEDLMQYLCDCENYHTCKWHQRLKDREDRRTIEQDMKEELYRREVEWDRRNAIADPVDE